MKVCPNPDCLDIEDCGVPGEYLDSVEICPTCGASLEAAKGVSGVTPPVASAHAPMGYELAGKVSDAAVVPVAKSLLESAGIMYVTKNETTQDLFGVGRLGIGYNPILGEVEFWVDPGDAREVQEILEDLKK